MTGETARAEDEAAGQPETAAAAAGDPKPSTSLDRELAEMKDRLLRTLAEMENLRKRTEREVTDARTYGVSSFARDVLSVADNIQRALEATGEDWKKHADEAGKALFDGVELTERDLLKALEKQGIRRIDPSGQKFDPNLHQAMYEVPDETIAPGTAVQVLQ